MSTRLVIAALALAAGATSAASASVTTYSDAPSFSAAVGSTPTYFNNFDSIVGGFTTSVINFGPVNGFSYGVDSSTTDGTAPGGGLFNAPGLLSTNIQGDAIRFTFTGAPVYSIGGNFWASDIDVNAIVGTIKVSLSSGEEFQFATSDASAYFGVISDSPIASFRVATTVSVLDPGWPTADNLTVGGAVPTPAAAAVLGLGALAAGRRRRSK